MGQGLEQNPPFELIFFAVLIVFTILSFFLRKKLRARALAREGQIFGEGGSIRPIEERIALRKDWAKGEIGSAGRGLMYAAWLLAVVWFLTFGVAFWKALTNPAATTGPRVVLGIFTFLGLGAVAFAVRVTIRWLRFGRSYCSIVGKAGVLGQIMKGVIRTAAPVEATGDFLVRVQCIETYHTGSGKNRTSHTDVHWQGHQTIPRAGMNSVRGIPFSIELPTEPPETGYQLSRGAINWQVSIEAPVAGVDYAAVFVVPVFKMS